MGSVKQLFDYFDKSDSDFARVYSAFCQEQQTAFVDTARYAGEKLAENFTDVEKCMVAIELALKANAMRIASQRIIESIDGKNKK